MRKTYGVRDYANAAAITLGCTLFLMTGWAWRGGGLCWWGCLCRGQVALAKDSAAIFSLQTCYYSIRGFLTVVRTCPDGRAGR